MVVKLSTEAAKESLGICLKGKVNMKYLIIMILVSLLSGCGAFISDDQAVQALNDAGYSEVSCTESHWIAPQLFGCSKDDGTAFECAATNSAGKRTQLTVCSSLLFKGSTIRH